MCFTSLKDKQEPVDTEAQGMSAGTGAGSTSNEHDSAGRPHRPLWKRFSFTY